MPAFFLNGVVVYFAASRQHMGMYLPVKGDGMLDK
jgi:hypothetical protein